MNGHIIDVSEDREALSRTAHVVLEIPLRGVTAVRFEASVDSTPVTLALHLCDFEADFEAPAVEEKP